MCRFMQKSFGHNLKNVEGKELTQKTRPVGLERDTSGSVPDPVNTYLFSTR